MGREEDNIIYVQFGGELRRPAEPPSARMQLEVQPPQHPPEEPAPGDTSLLSALYTTREVAKLFEITESRLRYWHRCGLVSPSTTRGKTRCYTFQDLVSVRAARDLLAAGVRAAEVQRALDAIRIALPRVTRPLAELRVIAEGEAVLVRDESVTFEPKTGQLVIDFQISEIESVVQALHKAPSEKARKTAFALYLDGCRLDESESYAGAERCYREALQLDPTLANAMTNLGNLRFREGAIKEAAALYEAAIRADIDQPEAHYNLGYLAARDKDYARARGHLETAIELDPELSDAHYHLATTLESLREFALAITHWRTFLALDPQSEWAHIAQAHLEQLLDA